MLERIASEQTETIRAQRDLITELTYRIGMLEQRRKPGPKPKLRVVPGQAA